MKKIQEIRELLSRIHGSRNAATHAVTDRDLECLAADVLEMEKSVVDLRQIVFTQIEEKKKTDRHIKHKAVPRIQ